LSILSYEAFLKKECSYTEFEQ